MLQTICKLPLNQIDYLEIECQNCNSQIQINLKKEQKATNCPVCNTPFDELTLKTISNITMTISTLKHLSKNNISLIKIEK
ncbi:hypothetical protein [Nautilia sp.]